MPQTEKMLSTQEFAKKAGVSAGTVSKWLRSGKLKGKKQSGKWMISASELIAVAETKSSAPKKKPAGKGAAAPKTKSSGKTFTVEEFSAMTYLTEFGVRKWIKEGKLTFTRDGSGQPCIDATNLENASIKHLIRK